MLVTSQVTKSVISLLNYYEWKQFSIIYEEKWEKVAESLSQQAKINNKTINHKKQVVDRHKCCEKMMDCCRPGYWYNVSSLSFSFQLHLYNNNDDHHHEWVVDIIVLYICINILFYEIVFGIKMFLSLSESLSQRIQADFKHHHVLQKSIKWKENELKHFRVFFAARSRSLSIKLLFT